jgi:hypothetical protein
MVQLIVLACLAGHPDRCQEFRVPTQGELNMVQCVWRSQMMAAEWQAQHPGWQIKRFSCGLPKA